MVVNWSLFTTGQMGELVVWVVSGPACVQWDY